MPYIPDFLPVSIGLGLNETVLLPSPCFASKEYQFIVNVNDNNNCNTVCLLKSNFVVACKQFNSNWTSKI